MEGCLLDLAKNEVPSLVNLVKNEAQYLCCFNNYVETFDRKRKILGAKHKDMKRDFQKGQGVFSFKYEALQWECEANDIININIQIKKKLIFGWCPNFCWQYRRGRKLAEETQHIDELLGRYNSNIIAGQAHVPDIKGISRPDFIHFESREQKFEDLKKLLQDGHCSMIGLQGMGGAGKTSMAKELAQKLKESKWIDKFIFLVVSQPPDFKKIRRELAKGLDIPNLDRVAEEEPSNTIGSRITNVDEKLLIILDDVWEKFDLTENLGIPNEQRQRGCTLLLTTRNSGVCSEMGCQTIHLDKLTEDEALDLFEKHATINSSSRGLKGMPQKIVKHCGGLPVAIVAVARALKNQPISVWKDALKTLEDGGADPNLEEAYQCLKLSYDNLKNQIARELLLVSSIFPEDDEIPIKCLIKIGIGLCSFNENGKYHLKRNEVDKAIMELLYSSLLLKGKEESVKMHDLVREVALKIGGKDIQSLVDLKKPINGNLRYLFWKNDGFPDKFDGNELEALLIFLEDSEDMNVSDTFFKEIAGLKVLVLGTEDFQRISALSLASSIQPLKNIQTLVLASLKLGDISVLGNLLSLRTLWFLNCSINELPREFVKLNKLWSLEVAYCEIENNNPFEVIESCSQLEELTFAGNECDPKQKGEIFEKGSPLILHRYCVSSADLSNKFEKYEFMSRCFRIDELSHLVSDATFNELVIRAELLILEGDNAQRKWKNLIPDIVPIHEGGTLNDLIVLHLSGLPDLECLIDTKNHESCVTAFCNLAELHLLEMSIEDLCRGPPPSSFLEQLEIMKLKECHELKRILPNGNYNLCYLKTMELHDCPKLTSVFHPSTAQSLKKLEELSITRCAELKNIIVGQDGDGNQKSPCEPLLPKLKTLQIAECNKLRIILPILSAGALASLEKISLCWCEQLEYIFDKFQEGEDAFLPSLRELELFGVPSLSGIFREYRCSSTQKPSPLPLSRHNSKKINESPVTRAFSWVQACCSLNKSRLASGRSLDHTNPPELDASTDGVHPFHGAQSLLVQSLKTVREMKLVECYSLISLSTLSIAASTMSLENLIICACHKLKCIATNEGDAQVAKNCCSIFPRLETLKIEDCKELEFLFISATSGGLEKLKSLTIEKVPELKYVVGNYQQEQHSSTQNQNEELHFQLLHLEKFYIRDAPKINGICTKNFKMVLSSLQKIEIWNCQHKSFADHNLVGWRTTEERDASIDGDPPLHLAKILLVQSLEIVREIKLGDCQNLISLSTLSIAASTMALENLTIYECHKLKCMATNEGDAQVAKNYCSIFPRLETLKIEDCKELEFLFTSATSVGLEKLKSLIIRKVPELKYVVGNYEKEQHSCNQNQMDQLRFDLPTLETLCIEDAPKMKSIYAKNYKLLLSSPLNVHIGNCDIKSFTTQELDAPTDGVPLLHGAQSLFIHSLKTVRKIELEECGNIRSLSTLSIAASTMSLENLIIRECHKLKCIITNEGDAQVAQNRCSIFPRLETLEIKDCKELEFLFISAISCALQKLKSLTIKKVPELKYVVGNYQQEQYSSNQNQNEELHFQLLDLETFYIEYAPKINDICTKNFKMVLPSLQKIEIRNCQNKSFTDHNLVGWRTTEERDASTDGDPPLHLAKILLVQSLETVRKIELNDCQNLISLSTVSIAASTIALENLTICECNKLKCIIAYEDVGTHMSCNSIFPKLKELQVSNCGALEYLFPAFAFRSPSYLESLSIHSTPMLKYMLLHEDILIHENQTKQNPIDFPAMSNLSIWDVPQLVSICPENYYLRGLSLRSISLGGFSMRASNEFLVFWHTNQQETKATGLRLQNVERLEVNDSKVEEIFDLTHVDMRQNGDGHEPLTSSLQGLILRNLSELEHICVGPKHIMCFHSLEMLSINSCKKLKVIFSASVVRSLPILNELNISECEELVHIVEEDYVMNADDHLCHEPCFPNLEKVYVNDCDKLKYMFSVTLSDTLPKLWDLDIRKAHELEHVLIRRGEMKEMVMKDVLPQLKWLQLIELQNLVSICHGIDFQTLADNWRVNICDCLNFSFYETSATRLQIGLESADSEAKEKAEEKLSSHQSTEQYTNMGDTPQQSRIKKEPIHSSPDNSDLRTRDNTHKSAKIFQKEEEEKGGLIASHRPRYDIMKDDNSLSKKKHETFIPDDVQVCDKSHPHSSTYKEEGIVQNESKSNVEQINLTQRDQESSYSKDSQPRTAVTATPFVTVSKDESLKDELISKDVEKETNRMDPHSLDGETRLDIQSKETKNIVEVKAEEGASLETSHPSSLTSKKEPIPVSSKPTILPRSQSTTAKILEEQGDPVVPPKPIISSEQASKTMLPLSLVPSKALTSPKQIPMSTPSEPNNAYGKNIQENVGTTSQPLHEASGPFQISSQLAVTAPSICETNNALTVAGVKEIVDLMKLEGIEPSLLAEAFKTNPQLRLSLEDRSTDLLCYSYKVLLNILNILATRSPFTINEADKRLLAKHLKDASILGFDKDWLESIITKVFNNCDLSELHHVQELLKGLGTKLQGKKKALANVRDKEAEAAKSVEAAQKELEATHKELEAAQSHFNVAQQEHAHVRIRHSQLLEECQEILEQRDQYLEILAAKLRPFGF